MCDIAHPGSGEALRFLRRGKTSWRVPVRIVNSLVIGLMLPSVMLPANPPELSLRFGLYTHESQNEIDVKFGHVFEHLETSLGKKLGKTVKIQRRVYKDYRDGRQAVIDGDMDFMRLGAASYALAQHYLADHKQPLLNLLVNQREDGNVEVQFKGIIFTRRDSGINSLADLEGRTFAFGDKDSSTGSYLPKELLLGAGIHGKDLKRFEHHADHKQTVLAVVEGRFDAGAAKESVFKQFGKDVLKPLATITHHIGMPWVARSGLDPEIVAGLRAGLLSVPPGSSKESTGFEEREDKDYDYIRVALEKAATFEAGVALAASNAPTASTGSLSAWAQALMVAGCALVLVMALGLAVARWRRHSPRLPG
jgi:phosphonate transport system substrate-binding protein